jgi:hypothetical protein
VQDGSDHTNDLSLSVSEIRTRLRIGALGAVVLYRNGFKDCSKSARSCPESLWTRTSSSSSGASIVVFVVEGTLICQFGHEIQLRSLHPRFIGL